MNKPHTIIASVFITVAIILGALAAHSLKEVLTEELTETFAKGVTYMMYSGLGVLILSLNHDRFKFSMKATYLLIEIGCVLFSINIFIYTFHMQLPMLKNFVHIVPVGGLCMILGWLILVVKLIKNNSLNPIDSEILNDN